MKEAALSVVGFGSHPVVIIQAASQTVAFATDGQLFEGSGVAGQLRIGLGQGLALCALFFKQADDDIADQQK
jgi:hypothetical protein